MEAIRLEISTNSGNIATASGISDSICQDKISSIRQNVSAWYSFWGVNIYEGRRDSEFLSLTQWLPSEISYLESISKPIRQVNILYHYYKQFIGIFQQNIPDIAVLAGQSNPSNDNELAQLNKKIALTEGIVRGIYKDSQMKNAQVTSMENAASRGWGGLRVTLEWDSKNKLDQVIRVEAPLNSEYIGFDVFAKTPHKGDGKYAFSLSFMDIDKYNLKYPDEPLPKNWITNIGFGADFFTLFPWVSYKKSVPVLEYFEKEYRNVKYVRLENGETFSEKEYEENYKEYNELYKKLKKFNPELIRPFPKIIEEGSRIDYDIYYYVVIPGKIIERSKFPGKELPIILQDLDKVSFLGREITQSFHRHAISAQKMLNQVAVEYSQSLITSRKETLMYTEEMIAGNEKQFQNPAIVMGGIKYRKDTNPIGESMPTIIQNSHPEIGFLQSFQAHVQMIETILGVMGSSVAMSGGNISGEARRVSIKQANTAYYKFLESGNTLLQQCNKVVLGLIPEVYGHKRWANVINRDGSGGYKMLNFNQGNQDDNNIEDIDKFNIDITVAAPDDIQKAEIIEKIAIISNQINPLYQDVAFKGLQFPGAETLSMRAQEANVPPSILAKEKGLPPPAPQPPPPNPMAQLEQAKIQVEMGKNQNAQMANQLKAQELQMQQSQFSAKHQLDSTKNVLDYTQSLQKTDAEKTKSLAEVAKAKIEYAADINQKHYDHSKNVLDFLKNGQNLMKDLKNSDYVEPEGSSQKQDTSVD